MAGTSASRSRPAGATRGREALNLDALPLGRKQVLSIGQADARINIWEGSVRSGKTIASLLRFLIFVASAPAGGHLLVVGKTLDTLARNVFGPLQDPALFGPIAHLIRYTRGATTATILGRTVEVMGANDAKAEPRLRGLTAAGAYVDEATLVPEAFWAQLLARLSVPGARLFATTNPDGPQHWLRQSYLLRAAHLGLRSWHFTLDDNPALDPEYVAALKREYTGLWYRRFILGEWCLAEGAIYDMWDAARHVVDEIPPIVRWIGLGVDYGTVNPFHALLVGLARDGRLYVTGEWRHDSRTTMRQLTDDAYSAGLRTWLDQLGAAPEYVVIDPSAASFLAQLHHDRMRGVVGAVNDVQDGIRTVARLLATDRLRIHRSARHLIDEFPGYSWDPKAAEKGEDRPIKVADHGLDGLRYVLHTTESVYRTHLRPPGGDIRAAA